MMMMIPTNAAAAAAAAAAQKNVLQNYYSRASLASRKGAAEASVLACIEILFLTLLTQNAKLKLTAAPF
jgi:hypothetical protein